MEDAFRDRLTEQLAELRARGLFLTRTGLASGRPAYDEAPDELLEEDGFREVLWLVSWLTVNGVEVGVRAHPESSYRLKHVIERRVRFVHGYSAVYLSNGALIAACGLMGYQVKHWAPYNARLWLDGESFQAADRLPPGPPPGCRALLRVV